MGEFFLSLGNDLQNDSGWNVNANTEQRKIWERWRKKEGSNWGHSCCDDFSTGREKKILTAQQELNQIRSGDQEW